MHKLSVVETFRNILDGWKNYLDKSEVTEKKAELRAIVCAKCPSKKHGKLLTFVKDDLKEVEGFYCKECGCPLSAKIRSRDKCPLGKW